MNLGVRTQTVIAGDQSELPALTLAPSGVRGQAFMRFDLAITVSEGSRFFLELASHDPELRSLAEEWKRTRQKASSSVTKWVTHPAYQRIIGKGMAAIPFILRELQREPDHWFWALNAITGADPVGEEDRGDIGAMVRAWLDWGRQGGYL